MKKILMLAVVLGLLVSGCAVQKHCFVNPLLNREYTVTAGSRLVEKIECYGRVTVNKCTGGLWLVFLGKTGGNIRIQSVVGTAIGVAKGSALTSTPDGLAVTRLSSVSQTPIITEILYPESSKFIEFQDVKIEILEVTDSRITFKLIGISTQGCNKVNGQEVNEGVTK
jgi:hypothetical protein